jgi:hypothetical protein
MTLAAIIIANLTRDQLKQVVDDLALSDVDRRRPSSMCKALSQSRRATPEKLLPYLDKATLKTVCDETGVPSNGAREELTERLSSLSVGTTCAPCGSGKKFKKRCLKKRNDDHLSN